MMFSSLRSKLLLSYALIIFVALFIAGAASLVLMERYQHRANLASLQALGTSVALRLPELYAQGRADSIQRLRQQAQRLNLRLLLVADDGTVVADTAVKGLKGDRVPVPPDKNPRLPSVIPYRTDDGRDLTLVYVIIPSDVPVETLTLLQPPPRYVVIAVPETASLAVWLDLLPSLAGAAALALVVSVLVSLLLSRSITRPLEAMTRASEEMAQGRYEQEIAAPAATSNDEVGRLARAFNAMAREVNRSRQAQRDFVANVSHDLRTPLTSIQGFSQAIIEGAVREEAGYRRAAEIIHQEAERLGRLVGELLDLARIESGQVVLVKEAVDVGELARGCVERFAPQAQEAGVELTMDVPADLPPLLGDPDRLSQALSNLIDNACKYTPRGGHVWVTAERASPKAISLIVADDGPGIPADELPRLFERFYRVDKSRTRARGTGLGLAIVKEIVLAHGGTIEAKSAAGQGTRIIATLPTV